MTDVAPRADCTGDAFLCAAAASTLSIDAFVSEHTIIKKNEAESGEPLGGLRRGVHGAAKTSLRATATIMQVTEGTSCHIVHCKALVVRCCRARCRWLERRMDLFAPAAGSGTSRLTDVIALRGSGGCNTHLPPCTRTRDRGGATVSRVPGGRSQCLTQNGPGVADTPSVAWTTQWEPELGKVLHNTTGGRGNEPRTG